jgi:tryptophan synthase alpha chain
MIRNHIEQVNKRHKKALAVFLTAGYPDVRTFVPLATEILTAGADIFEIGIPFSDPIADGPIIQQSSQIALEQGVDIPLTFKFCEAIKRNSDKPLVLMGYANPVINYGIKYFIQDAKNSGVAGLILPDVPLEEYDDFWGRNHSDIDIILLTTPTSTLERIQRIDSRSSGFVYCVSLTGTTGVREAFKGAVINNLKRTYQQITNNKMLVGFGIAKSSDITRFSDYCDGVIVGSAVIKSIMYDHMRIFKDTVNLVEELNRACKIK